MSNTPILGGGVTGLAAGIASGLPVYEAQVTPGGICASYYVRPDGSRLPSAPADGEAYRFEVGGGHWIFGGDPAVRRFISALAPGRMYKRRSAVYFPQDEVLVPYPLQNNLRFLGKDVTARAVAEMEAAPTGPFSTMADWLEGVFGRTLYRRFFRPFNERYTDGLMDEVAPQDAYKSPVSLAQVRSGASAHASPVGYNPRYFYPDDGLDTLAGRMAARADVRLAKEVVAIDPRQRTVHFSDGAEEPYEVLISTLPLRRAVEMAGVDVNPAPDPYTSVLVLNIGGTRGSWVPEEHWLYVPESKSGFHRVGLYSNVDEGFLPASSRAARDRVSIYVERAYRCGRERPDEAAVASYADAVVQELRGWGLLERMEAVDPTWIDIAYTWSWPGSGWAEDAMARLEEVGILQVGRYARWHFQGIADSIKEGFVAGTALRPA